MIMAAVLAAGTSSRMGKNKLALPWGKQTVLEATMNMVERSYAFDQRMVVLGFERDLWYDKWEADLSEDHFKWEIVINPMYRQGQGTSVAKVGEHLVLNFAYRDFDGVMFFLGDEPLLEEETVCQLIDVWEEDKEKIVVPVFEGKRGNPGIFPKWTFKELMKLQGDEGARALIENNPDRVVFVEVEDRGVITDLDTEEAYQAELTAWQNNR